MLSLSAPIMLAEETVFENPFHDVSPDAWYYDAVMYVTEQGLMQGMSATAFEPRAALSRAMVVTVLYRMEGTPEVVFEPTFDDVPAGQWYSEAVIWAANHEIVTGMGRGRFAPSDYITRQQLATMLLRYAAFKHYDRSVPADFDLANFFADSADVNDWAYEAVRWAVYHDLIPSVSGRFRPSGPATRAEYAVSLQRMIYRFELGEPLPPMNPQADRHHIPWQFLTYLEPNFRATIQETLIPQTVEVLLRHADGWAMISTDRGERWVYLWANMRYIERSVFLYDRPGGERVGRLDPQLVTILEQDGDWLQISTWLGPRWIFLGAGGLVPPQGDKQIALTFDDGPHPVYTRKLLDALYERGIPVTFFVLGQQVVANPELTRRIVAEGHEIANHSFSHPEFPRRSAAVIRDELYRTHNAIYQTTGVRPSLMRPPYGAHNATTRSVAAEFGYPLILWSVDTRDWESRNVNAILSHFFHPNGTPRIVDGDIILMHDIYGTTVEAAIRAVDRLIQYGFTFVTTSELLLSQRDTLTPGAVYLRR